MVEFNREAPPTGFSQQSLTAWLDRREDAMQIAFQEATEDLQFLADQLVFSQYASVDTTIPHVDGNIGTGWQPFDFFDRVTVNPKGIVLTVGGDFTFILDGIFQLSLVGFVEHDNLNAGRTFNVRIFNVTEGTPGSSIVIASARNVDGTVVPLVGLFEILPGDIGDIFRLEYGGTTSIYSAVVWDALQLSLFSVSEFRGILGVDPGAAALRMLTETGDAITTEDGDRITT